MSKTIQFNVDPDRITLDDLIILESGLFKAVDMRNFLARHVVGADGEYLPEDEARHTLGALTISQIKEAVAAFADSLKGIQEGAVPEVIGGGSE